MLNARGVSGGLATRATERNVPISCAVRSSESGIHVVTAKGEFLTELTLTILETKTDLLTRCHKQYLVNLSQIDEIVRTDPSTVTIKTRSGKVIPVSRRFLSQMKERLLIH